VRSTRDPRQKRIRNYIHISEMGARLVYWNTPTITTTTEGREGAVPCAPRCAIWRTVSLQSVALKATSNESKPPSAITGTSIVWRNRKPYFFYTRTLCMWRHIKTFNTSDPNVVSPLLISFVYCQSVRIMLINLQLTYFLIMHKILIPIF